MIATIDHVINHEIRSKAVKRFKEKGIILPTFAQMRNPQLIPDTIKNKLQKTGLWDLDPVNLFRISWKNEAKPSGGLYGNGNFIEIPQAISGVKARIVLMIGKWFPTGAHKVGAAYGCLAPRIITGGFDPTYHKAVWPSTGNYCRGGAFDSFLMGVTPVAILPQEMSRERFEWLKSIGSEIIATPGCESNVKEIYDECNHMRATRPDCIILNQFDEFGNPVWHYNVTGPAIEDIYNLLRTPTSRFSGFVSNTGSAGTIAAGDYLKSKFPHIKVTASEALQCPTLLQNGFGAHRIEGIGDKHIPWVHNIKNTDLVTAIDDEDCMRIIRLFNEPEGKKYLSEAGLDAEYIQSLSQIGISGVANMIGAIKQAKYFELTENDIIITIATDSMEMYQSRLDELNHANGAYSSIQAAKDHERCLLGIGLDYLKELTYPERKAIHNLKYFTWVEQQGKTVEEINQLWYDETLWPNLFNQAKRWDELIEAFNHDVIS